MIYIHIYIYLHIVVVQSLSHVWLFVTHGLQHARLLGPSLSPGVCSNSCPLSQWCHSAVQYIYIHIYVCIHNQIHGIILNKQVIYNRENKTFCLPWLIPSLILFLSLKNFLKHLLQGRSPGYGFLQCLFTTKILFLLHFWRIISKVQNFRLVGIFFSTLISLTHSWLDGF